MTSNLELDVILQQYLPKGSVLPCDTFHRLTVQKVKDIKQCLKERLCVYFPLFLRHHWIAGILQWDTNDAQASIHIYDSAPSQIVQSDMTKRFKAYWPQLHIEYADCWRQRRGSDDCGIFMTMVFLAYQCGAVIRPDRTLTKRMRALLATAHDTTPDVATFRREFLMVAARGRRTTLVAGGADADVPSTSDTHKAAGSTTGAGATSKPQAPTLPDTILKHVSRVVGEAAKAEKECARKNICYFLAAIALASVIDGTNRSLTPNSVGMQVHRKGFLANTQYDLGEALAASGFHLDLLMSEGRDFRLLPRIGRGRHEGICVQTHARGMPVTIEDWVFAIGAKHEGDGGTHGARSGHYTVSTNPGECTYGVYLPAEMQKYGPPRKRRSLYGTKCLRQKAPATADAAPDVSEPRSPLSEEPCKTSRGHDQDAGREVSYDILLEGASRLNDRDGRVGGTSRPRTWVIYGTRPPHVSAQAWAAITPAVRAAHIHWLRELRSMPADLLDRGLASAAIEMVRRLAVTRKWTWSTVDKNLSHIAGALRDLPLYTTEPHQVLLTDDPEWVAATKATRRLLRESDVTPAVPATADQIRDARRTLRTQFPRADLFLQLMWLSAARSGDITTLQCRDVSMSAAPTPAGEHTVTLAMRRGKGARFRGPYEVTVQLGKAESALLWSLLQNRPRRGKVFDPGDEIPKRVRAALRELNPDAAMASVRRGAVQHLAARGVPEEVLMSMTGHRRQETLQRYLGGGVRVTREGARPPDAGASAPRGRSTSA